MRTLAFVLPVDCIPFLLCQWNINCQLRGHVNCINKINESFVSVKKPSLFFEMQWRLFERYKEYDEYFFLLPKGNAFTAVIDKKKLISSEIQFVFEQLKKHQIKR